LRHTVNPKEELKTRAGEGREGDGERVISFAFRFIGKIVGMSLPSNVFVAVWSVSVQI
jgi:hypothetical protein